MTRDESFQMFCSVGLVVLLLALVVGLAGPFAAWVVKWFAWLG